jgi:hypothetical protein
MHLGRLKPFYTLRDLFELLNDLQHSLLLALRLVRPKDRMGLEMS